MIAILFQRFKASGTVVVIIMAAAVMYTLQLKYNNYYIGTYMDDANYIILAKSIVQGHGYRQINYPDTPLETRYPPGFPLVLVPFIKFAWEDLDVLKLPSVLATILAIFFGWKLFKVWGLEDQVALLSLSLFAFNPLIVGHSVAVMSESVFLAVLLLAVWTLERGNHFDHSATVVRLRWTIIAAFLAAMAAMIRTVGWLLLPAGILWLTGQHRWRCLSIFVLIFMICVSPWIFRNIAVAGSLFPEYEYQFSWQPATNQHAVYLGPSFLVGRITNNLRSYATSHLGDAMVPLLGPRVLEIFRGLGLDRASVVIGVILSGIIAYGMVQLRYVRGLGIFEWFALLYIVVLMIWPFTGERFLHPLVPLLCLALVHGLKGILQASRPVLRFQPQRVIVVFSLLLLILYLGRDLQMIYQPLSLRTTNLEAGSAYIREYAPDDAIVMVPHPMAWYVHLHRKTVPYPPRGTSTIQILNYINEFRVTHILVSRSLATPAPISLNPYTAGVLVPLLRNRPDCFLEVYNDPNNKVTIYRVLSTHRGNVGE